MSQLSRLAQFAFRQPVVRHGPPAAVVRVPGRWAMGDGRWAGHAPDERH